MQGTECGGIIKKDVIPPNEAPGPWVCEGSEAAPAGQAHMMSLWRNPHHADAITYKKYHENTIWPLRWKCWIRDAPYLCCQVLRDLIKGEAPSHADRSLDDDATSIHHQTAEEQQQRASDRTYAHSKIPKLSGSRPRPDIEGKYYPGAYAVQFEEGFRAHRLLFSLLILCTLGSTALATYLLQCYGLDLPGSAIPGAVLVLWPVLYVTLFITVWFKWAEAM